MSFNRRAPLDSVSERSAVLREQREREQAEAQRRQQDMSGRDKAPTGVVRGKYAFDEAKSAVGELNRKLDEAIDEVRQAFQREAQLVEAETMARQDDAQRAPSLDGRKAVR